MSKKPNRLRANKFQFAMTDDERRRLDEKCKTLGYRVITNFFLRVINNEPTHQNLFRETNTVFRNVANNTNQIAKHLNKNPIDIKDDAMLSEFSNRLDENKSMLVEILEKLKKI